MKVLLIVAATGYQPVEYGTPKKIFEEAGMEVVTASNQEEIAEAKDGTTTTVDLLIDDINVSDYAGIFFIGGPGSLENLDNEVSYNLLKSIETVPFGAICMATRILAKSGVLKGKRATGWNGDDRLTDVYTKYGVTYVEEPVVVDGNIITAVGPDASEKFAKTILSFLK